MVQGTLQVSDDSPAAMSPARISFSYYLRCRSEPVQPCTPLPSSDFDFCVRQSCGQDSPSADELFSDGKILPAEINETAHKPKSPQNPALPTPAEVAEKQSSEVSSEEKEKQSGNGNGKSFWPFKSSSLNCVSGHGPTFCPLPLLSRSSSTGSRRTGKPAPVKRRYGGHGNGVRVNPVLHAPVANRVNPVLHVPVGNIFGMGSIFSSFNGRDNKNKIINK